MKKILVCFDFGGPICDNQHRRGEMDLTIKPVEGSFQQIRTIIEKVGAENVHIISKCSERAEGFIMSWLTHHNFYELTGFMESSDHIHFCRERDQKAPIILGLLNDDQEYSRVIMVDDRWSVFENFDFRPVVPEGQSISVHPILFNPLDEERVTWEKSLSSRNYVAGLVFHATQWRDTHLIFKNLLRRP